LTAPATFCTLAAVRLATLIAVVLATSLQGCRETTGRGAPLEAGHAAEGRQGAATDAPAVEARRSPSTDGGPGAVDAAPARAGAVIAIAASTVLAGSRPGTPGRASETEMDDEPIELPGFEIDALPYPNDPARQPVTGVTHERASQLCAEKGRRLCHELEWELACEGPAGHLYPAGDVYEPSRYEAANDLVSGAGVRAMGALAEWTAGELGGETKGVKAVRGVDPGKATAATRRCARRVGLEPSSSEPWLSFRCCSGAAPQAVYATPVYQPPFTRLELGPEEFKAMVQSVPELRRIHADPVLYGREDLFKIRSQGGLSDSITAAGALSYKALRWIPRVGDEIVVAAGRNGRDAFVVALYEMPGGRFAHAASYVLVNESFPIVLAYTKNPRHIRWMPCWDCVDGGLITLDDQGLVDISQRW
jgi:hypothetical protein